MTRNILELKNKAQKNLRVLDAVITVASFSWAVYIYINKGFCFSFWFWLGFAIISLIMVITNPVAKVEKKLMSSIVKGRK